MQQCRNLDRLAQCLPKLQPLYVPRGATLGVTPATAIIVPYRGRPKELAKFMYWLIPTLLRQEIVFKVYVVEELEYRMWNKAQMLNIGVVEANRDLAWDCFVFHDVDRAKSSPLGLDARGTSTCATAHGACVLCACAERYRRRGSGLAHVRST